MCKTMGKIKYPVIILLEEVYNTIDSKIIENVYQMIKYLMSNIIDQPVTITKSKDSTLC